MDDDFRWAADEEGFDYGVVPKPNKPISSYVLSASTASVTLSQVVLGSSLPVESSPVGHRVNSTTNTCITLLETLLSDIRVLCKSSISGLGTASGLAVTNTGIMDHMLPDASVFISYKQVADLSDHMGNTLLYHSVAKEPQCLH